MKLLLSVMILVLAIPAHGFYENSADTFEARGLLRLYGLGVDYPNPVDFDSPEDESGIAAFARLLMQGRAGQSFAWEANIYQSYVPANLLFPVRISGRLRDVERSSTLERNFSDTDYAHFAVDRLNARWQSERWTLVAGRQAINLATTRYFSPNDFFAPFAAENFYRVYKPGVDALRMEWDYSALSQVGVYGVLGYAKDETSDTGWSRSPDDERSSLLASWRGVIGDSEWGVLIGELSDRETIGFSYQGDLIANLGLLAELNWSQPDDQDDHRFQGVIGFDHRWSNTLHWQLEYYRNGYGSSQREDYPGLILSTRPVGYLGRDYTAFAVNYEWTPLLMTNFLWLQNWNDRSGSATINTLISLSDEAELVFNLGMPYGSAGSGGSGASEYGLAPNSLFIEYRHYF